MIPYFQLTHFNLGPITIQVWGLCVALGILAAVFLMNRLAKKYLLSPDVIMDLSLWILVAAFVGARFVHVVFYDGAYYLQYPVEILKVWHGGLSSLGGFVGAAAGIWLFVKKRKFSWKELVPYFDIAAVGLWLGWGVGRIGCFLIHDHPGALTHFVGAVKYPGILTTNDPDVVVGVMREYAPRHDLGLYESLVGFLLFTFYYLLFPKLTKKGRGLVAQYSVLSYATIRFLVDFLRATDLPGSDVRYAYLTPAQWGMAVVILTLTGWIIRGRIGQVKK